MEKSIEILREYRRAAVLGLLLFVYPFTACTGASENEATYVAPKPHGTYPAKPAVIQAWIDATDLSRIRAHAWNIWASITADSGIDGLPVWETWYSGHEIFDLAPVTGTLSRKALRDFERPAQFNHAAAGQIPIDLPENLTSFNRFTESLASYIVDNNYNETATLIAINDAFDKNQTAVVDRKILTSKSAVDASQIVLKPVFQFISSTEPTVIPYWAGVAPAYTTNLENPEPKTWRQGVVVDPTGKLKPGSTVEMSVNNEAPKMLPVVALTDFYHIVLSKAEADAFFTSFGFGSGDDVGAGNDTSKQALKDVVKEGGIALFMAMHVTTKEISNWTWQTFWWSHHPNDALFGRDRPKAIRGVWANYNMRTAYFMVSPPNSPIGEPFISYNPYLETNLQGTVPGPIVSGADGVETQTKIAWTGVHTNCMSCHRMAGYLTQGYQPDGLIQPDDPTLFGKGTKTDFLWSIAIRGHSDKKSE